jgi:hypothetical protein
MNASRSISANFVAVPAPTTYTISVSALPTVGGTVSGAGTFPSGTTVTLAATAASGYTFANWTESSSVLSTSGSYQFTADQNRTLVAAFTQNPTSTILLQDNFDDESFDLTKWVVVQNEASRVAEENGMMKVETTETDRSGQLRTQPMTVPMDKPWTLTRRVLLHRDTPYTYAGGDKFFTGYMRFMIDQVPSFGVWYCDYDYGGDAPGRLPKHGFVLAKNGAGGTTNPNSGNVSAEISPLILDEWFNEKFSYNPLSGIVSYFVNDVLRAEFNVGVPPASTPRSMQIEFEAYAWWTTHYQHFDNFLLKSGD